MASTASHKNTIVRDSNVSARLAHVALAAQVELQGSDCSRALYQAAQAFNAELFEGALLPLFVEITPPGSMRALADYRMRTHEGVDSHIRIGHRVLERGARFTLDVLLHEMVHAYCTELLGVDENDKTERAYDWHGPKFTAQCNRIGRKLGLGEVFAKGRGGPKSSQGPMSVRPAGYYGEPTATEPKGDEGTEPSEPKAPPTVDDQEKIRKQLARLLAKADRATLEAVAIVVGERLAG